MKDSPTPYVIIGTMICLLLALLWQNRRPHFEEGRQVFGEPYQGSASTPDWEVGDYRLSAVASFDIEAIVLHTQRYWFDDIADLVPIDLALGWGPMSEGEVLNELRVYQGDRFYYWKRSSLLRPAEIGQHSTNLHAIPADSTIKKQLFAIDVGDIVQLTGVLINAYKPGGWTMKTSVSRTDTLGGACEVMWVESVTLNR
ncbi:MAG: hypothetical protein HN348_02545 [Proteobacteria bacterium]|jgi:hypothetical protein|nr:hypothetical protein [Pseudomonadota bacterium]